MKPLNIIDTLFIGIYSMYQKSNDNPLFDPKRFWGAFFLEDPVSSSYAVLSAIFIFNLFILNNLCELVFGASILSFLIHYNTSLVYGVGILLGSFIPIIVYLSYIRNRKYRLLSIIFNNYDEKKQKKIKRYIIIYLIFLIFLFFYSSIFWIKPKGLHKHTTTTSPYSKMIQKVPIEDNSIKPLYTPFSNRRDTLFK